MAPKSISSESRPYRSALRQQQAGATRARVIASAAKLFAADGYARTTLAKIAADAGVSTETVQSHGPKAALLKAACEDAAFGAGGVDLLELEIGRRLLAIDDRDRAVDFLVAMQTEVQQRTAPLGSVLIAAASDDPELDSYVAEVITGVTSQVRSVCLVFRDRGWIRTDVDFEDVVQTAAVICSLDTYQRLTDRAGWSVDRYRDWCRRMMIQTVLA